MEQSAKAARAQYMREYRAKNKERIAKINERHWERKAALKNNEKTQ